jgi:hypothetical protein
MPESPICGFSFREKMKQWRTHRATIAQAAEIPSGGLDESRKAAIRDCARLPRIPLCSSHATLLY